jgi:tRNA modification GTPase
MTPDTIVAPATPYGFGGLSVVRLSGVNAHALIKRCSRHRDGSVPKLKHRVTTLVTLHDNDGGAFDKAMVVFFKGPNSYTGEDLVEISCHGSPVIVQTLVSVLTKSGARLAEPGEFTRRALINGKLDLVQAEAVAALIHAQTNESSRLNYQLMRGELSVKLLSLRQHLVDLLSQVELELDVSEDELQPDLMNQVRRILEPLLTDIKTLLSTYHQGRLLTRGALVVIAGPPNVGKSTLLNALSETARAITSTAPGTTRDPIDISLFIDGVPITLVDTAGLRKSGGPIEREGISRARNYLEKADLILYIGDNTVLPHENDFAASKGIPVIYIVNKGDLLTKPVKDKTALDYPDYLIISALKNVGLSILKRKLKERLGISGALTHTVALTTERQHDALRRCQENLRRSLAMLSVSKIEFELLSIELREGLTALDEILGKTTPEDLLNNIFNRFCVGK